MGALRHVVGIVLAVFAGIGACASGVAGAAIEDLPANAPTPNCAIEVEFATRRGDVDRTTLDRVVRYVEGARDVGRAFELRNPQTGEGMLCLVVEDARRAKAIFEDLTILVPTRGRKLPRLKPPPPVVLRLNGP